MVPCCRGARGNALLTRSNFLQTIQAAIDASECTLWSKFMQRYIPLYKNEKNLRLMKIDDLWGVSEEGTICQVQTQPIKAGQSTRLSCQFSQDDGKKTTGVSVVGSHVRRWVQPAVQ